MRRFISTTRVLAVAVTACLLCSPFSQAKKPDRPGGGGGGGGDSAPSYQIIELDNFDGLFSGFAFNINNVGQAVGHINDGLYDHDVAAGWVIDNSGPQLPTTLQTLTDGTVANDVNDLGEIVGERVDDSDPQNPAWSALYWEHADAEPLVLPVPEGATVAAAESINHDSVICGWAATFDPQQQRYVQDGLVWRINFEDVGGKILPVVWGPLVLPAVTPDGSVQPVDINDSDTDGIVRVVGSEFEAEENAPAAIAWDVMLLADGSLVASPMVDVLDIDAQGYGVNNARATCGARSVDAIVWEDSATHILDRSATIRPSIGKRKPISFATAHRISNGGVIVGQANASVYRKAVVWPSVDAPIILLDNFLKKNSSFTELNRAVGVNDAGEIVGYGWDNERGIHPGFLAIPE